MLQTPRPPLDSHPKRMLEMLVLAMLAFGGSLWISANVFSNQLLFAEEGNALFQAHNFLDGTHSRNPRGFAELVAYDSMTLIPHQDWKSRFAPGHPFWLVPGVWISWPQLMTALSAMITMMAVYGIGWRLRIPRLLLPLLLLASPFFLFLHGTLLPHTSGMLFSCLFLLGYLKWRQERSLLWAFLSGFSWSLLLQIHPMTAVFILIPFGIDVMVELSLSRKDGRAWLGTFLFLTASLIGIWAVLRYNKVSTGDAFLATYLEHEPSENWGFGLRRTQGGGVTPIEHTIKRGWILLWANLRSLDRWLLGGFTGSLLIWFGLLVHGWNRRWSGLLLGTVLFVLLGYMAFWEDGRSPVGPLHTAEILPWILVLGALGLSRIWRKLSDRARARNTLFLLFTVYTLYFSVPFVLEQARSIRRDHAEAWQVARQVESLPENSLVFLPADFLKAETLRVNLPLNVDGWDTPVLRLQARPADRAALAASFPERNVYELLSEPAVHLKPVELTWTPVSRLAANSQHSPNAGANHGDERSASETLHLPGLLFYGWYPYLPPGTYECRFDLRWSEVDAAKPLRLEVMADRGTVSLGEQVLAEGLDDSGIRFTLPEARQVEPRVYFGGSGQVTLREVSITPVVYDLSAQPLP